MGVEQAKQVILELPPNDFRIFSAWFAELEQQRWDRQIEEDVAAGKLDALADEAMRDFAAGRCREL